MAARKTERILNLLIGLMSSRQGRTRGYLTQTVYRYWVDEGNSDEALERMFLRDIAELKDLGVPVQKLGEESSDEDPHAVRYRVEAADYLLPTMEFSPRERLLLQLAAQLWEQGSLRDAGDAAVRKLGGEAHDVGAQPASLMPSVSVGGALLHVLHETLSASRVALFDYRTARGAETVPRRVRPYGLGNHSGQWYLVGFDLDRQAQRTFRLSRIVGAVKPGPKATAGIPADFSIEESLQRMREYPVQRATVRLSGDGQHLWRHRATSIRGDLAEVEYQDEAQFIAELSTAAPGVVLLSPPDLVAEVAARLERASAIMSLPPAEVSFEAPRARRGPKPGASDPVQRLLAMIPYLVRHEGIGKAELAAEFGISASTLDDDLDRIRLVGRPDGFHDDLMDVMDDGERVWIQNALDLKAPVQFQPEEAWTLLVGLRALADIVGAQDQDLIKDLMVRLAAAGGDSARLAANIHVDLTPARQVAEKVDELAAAVSNRRQVRLEYIVPSRDEVTHRDVDPHRVRLYDGQWYLDAWCHAVSGERVFRVDRIAALDTLEVQVLTDPWPLVESAEIAAADTAVLAADPDQRWLLSRFNALRNTELPDGGLLAEIRVTTPDWLAHLVAQTGGGIRVVAPEVTISHVRDILEQSVAAYATVRSSVEGTLD